MQKPISKWFWVSFVLVYGGYFISIAGLWPTPQIEWLQYAGLGAAIVGALLLIIVVLRDVGLPTYSISEQEC